MSEQLTTPLQCPRPAASRSARQAQGEKDGQVAPQQPKSMKERVEELRSRKEQALHAGSRQAVEVQHDKGKLTARERIDGLLDPGSFVETDMLATHRATAFGMDKRRIPGDGVVTGYGTIGGRRVCLYSQDFTVFGGSLGEVMAEKICKVMDLSLKMGCRASASTTPAGPAFRRAWSPCPATPRSSGATSRRPGWSPSCR